MKKIIFIAFLFCVLGGCEFPQNPIIETANQKRLEYEAACSVLNAQAEQWPKDFNDFVVKVGDFVAGLTEEQLTKYENFVFSKDGIERLRAQRALQNTLTEIQFKDFLNLQAQDSELQQRRIAILNNYQTLQKEWENTRQLIMTAFIAQQQQQAWQQQQWNENWQRQLDRQAYGRQPVFIQPQPPTYFIRPAPSGNGWIATP